MSCSAGFDVTRLAFMCVVYMSGVVLRRYILCAVHRHMTMLVSVPFSKCYSPRLVPFILPAAPASWYEGVY
jgi:hypothetical protein